MSDGIEWTVRRVRRVVADSPASEAGVLDTPEMLTSDARAVTSTLLSRGFLDDFTNVSVSRTTTTALFHDHCK